MKRRMTTVCAAAVLVAIAGRSFPEAQGGKMIPMTISGAKPGAAIDVAMNSGKLGTVTADAKGSAAISLAMNAGKISLVSSGSNATATNPLDIANQGKVQAQIAVETCKDGKTTIILITKGEQVPKDDNCDRKMSGVFWVDKVKTIEVSAATGLTAVQTAGISPLLYGVIGGGGAAAAGLALAGGGSDSPSSSSGTSTAPAVLPVPTPAPTPPASGVSPTAIGGEYFASGSVSGPSCGLVQTFTRVGMKITGDALDKMRLDIVTTFSTLIGSRERDYGITVNADGTFQGSTGATVTANGQVEYAFSATVTGRFTVGSSGSMTLSFTETINFTQMSIPNCALGSATIAATATK